MGSMALAGMIACFTIGLLAVVFGVINPYAPALLVGVILIVIGIAIGTISKRRKKQF